MGLNIDKIKHVGSRVHPLVLPRDGPESKFSIYHGAAFGILFSKATPALSVDGAMTDTKTVEVRETGQAESSRSVELTSAPSRYSWTMMVR